ncbi:TetR/AcrR family transcriptional regulator [Clostridium felsineum]|uniref:TetR/AcrR family transcriptional regulator n=1 Tax=Clostridium felsineum TaxID=36839 RepID=UPI00098BFC54|nr:TetR/AcrR family transcriptional regulator [Clostridium felsineum]URZ03120.1 hypothetical protein CLAUR_031660 [Clostridium felsineum]
MECSWHENVKNKNRQEIIAAGKKLFLKHSFLSVTIKDVCTLAGISRVTFYKYFKAIDELIFEVQIEILTNMRKFIVAVDKCEGNGLKRLEKMIYAWIEFAKLHREEIGFVVLFDIYYETYDSNKELKTKYEDFIQSDNKLFLSHVINEGIMDKSLRHDLDIVKVQYYIFQATMGLVERISLTKIPDNKEGITSEDITKMHLDMILNYVRS